MSGYELQKESLNGLRAQQCLVALIFMMLGSFFKGVKLAQDTGSARLPLGDWAEQVNFELFKAFT